MNRLKSIDILRGLACLAVLFSHISRESGTSNHWFHTLLFLPMDFGYLGVPLFLLISGFCIHGKAAQLLSENKTIDIHWIAFWRRRFWRLYPPYLVTMFLSIATYYLVPAHDSYRIINLPCDIISHVLMIHNLFADYASGLGNGAFWTLGLEEQLYALYAVYLFFRRRLPPAKVLLVVAAFTFLWRLALPNNYGQTIGMAPLELGAWQFWPFAHWAFWVAGALAAEAHSGAIKLPSWCYDGRVVFLSFGIGVATASISLGRFAASNWARSSLSDTTLNVVQHLIWLCDPAFFCLGLFIIMNRWTHRETHDGLDFPGAEQLALIGIISYSLYLVHVPVLRILEHLLPITNGTTGTMMRYGVYSPVCLLAAWGFYWTVERHFVRQKIHKIHSSSQEFQTTFDIT